MSKSNAIEIIALLWLIACLLTDSTWLQWGFGLLAVENMIESAVWAVRERRNS
jgi:hypothetical protein